MSDAIKKFLNGLEQNPSPEISNMESALTAGKQNEINENDLKTINQTLSGKATYRSSMAANKTMPAEILASASGLRTSDQLSNRSVACRDLRRVETHAERRRDLATRARACPIECPVCGRRAPRPRPA